MKSFFFNRFTKLLTTGGPVCPSPQNKRVHNFASLIMVLTKRSRPDRLTAGKKGESNLGSQLRSQCRWFAAEKLKNNC